MGSIPTAFTTPQIRGRITVTIYQTLHQPHLQADEITTRTKSRLLLTLVKQLRPVVESIAEYDKAITDLF